MAENKPTAQAWLEVWESLPADQKTGAINQRLIELVAWIAQCPVEKMLQAADERQLRRSMVDLDSAVTYWDTHLTAAMANFDKFNTGLKETERLSSNLVDNINKLSQLMHSSTMREGMKQLREMVELMRALKDLQDANFFTTGLFQVLQDAHTKAHPETVKGDPNGQSP